MLPESPPDSSSEACSPPQIPGSVQLLRLLQEEFLGLYSFFGNWNKTVHLWLADFHYEAPYWSNQQTPHEVFQPTHRPAPSSSCRFKNQGPAPTHNELLTHDQLRSLGLTNTYIKSGTSPAPPPPAPLHQHRHHSPEHTHYLSPETCSQVYTPPTPPSPPQPPSNSYATHCTGPGLVPHLSTPPSAGLLGSTSILHTR